MKQLILVSYLGLLFTSTACIFRQQQVPSEAEEKTETASYPDTGVTQDTDFSMTSSYLYLVSNGDTIDKSLSEWNVEIINGRFNSAVNTERMRSFQLQDIDILELKLGEGILETGRVVYVNPSSLPMKKKIANTTSKYNRSSFGEYEKVLIIGSGQFQQNDSSIVFTYGFIENFPDAEFIDEYEEEYIDEE